MTPSPIALRLREELRRRLQRYISPGTRVALVDFPNHRNVGDSAIWAGERQILADLGVDRAYVAETGDGSVAAIRRALRPSDAVLLHGGGNFGDLWPYWQLERERLVTSLDDRRIVQMPQTLFFADDRNRQRAAGALAQHPGLVVLCRDGPSVRVACDLGLTAELCPDAAFALAGHLPRRGPFDTPQLWLARTDKEWRGENLGSARLGPGQVRVDWDDLPPSRLERTLARTAREVVARLTRRRLVPRVAVPAIRATLDGLAGERVRQGTRLLSRGRVVVTDRLHAHILCLLLDIPHVLVDPGFGKLAGFAETWDTTGSRAVLSPSITAAGRAAEELLAGEAARERSS